MHFMGFVFVDAPTEEAVAKAMEDSKERHWDWYRPGGRWDGYLQGEEEMKRRQTHNGFNFDDNNESAAANSVRVKDLSEGKSPYFFVVGGDWVPKEYFNEYEKSPHYDGYGTVLPTPHFDERWKEALENNQDKFVVVVDAHH